MQSSTTYNVLAGRDLGRLAALSDGVFAFAMTLLVLDLRVPAVAAIKDEHQLATALLALAPRLVPYVMTFLTLGIFWVGHQTQLTLLDRTDRNLAWLTIAFLFTVTLMPFSTSLLAEFLAFRLALITYWLNILLLGVTLGAMWAYARRSSLTSAEVTYEVSATVVRRIVVAQSLYAFGAALCAFNTYVSIVFIVVVQLNYVLAPRIWPLDRL
ncbi:MAG: DUF1211 domain-containing protein [Candidatus Eremiobacteraeota bacterium]|nr:DUF1211 domain-containing protein [Candidatus Eremiobacteraeota bacterium]